MSDFGKFTGLESLSIRNMAAKSRIVIPIIAPKAITLRFIAPIKAFPVPVHAVWNGKPQIRFALSRGFAKCGEVCTNAKLQICHP